jgi:hypothetical protein
MYIPRPPIHIRWWRLYEQYGWLHKIVSYLYVYIYVYIFYIYTHLYVYYTHVYTYILLYVPVYTEGDGYAMDIEDHIKLDPTYICIHIDMCI